LFPLDGGSRKWSRSLRNQGDGAVRSSGELIGTAKEHDEDKEVTGEEMVADDDRQSYVTAEEEFRRLSLISQNGKEGTDG
jgi:hypothetical protein